jgi:oxepin-CoA hydrolase/3-oxo-5,6-dehydrosuberyl-CoA semialdehyde dehydrogenase
VLANYGLEGLRFVKPVYVGDTIYVKLTCKQKTAKEDREGQVAQGVVAWDVEVRNQSEELVATYTVLTLVRQRPHAESRPGGAAGPAVAPVPEPGKTAPTT